MEVQVIEYIDVTQRAKELGLNVPTGLTILPRNFDTATLSDELIQESTAPTIRSLWRQSGVVETRLEKDGTKFPQGAKKSAEWISPIIYIGGMVFTNAALPLTINMISSYLYDFFKGRHDKANVTIRFAIERNEHTKAGEGRKSLLFTFKGTPKEWQEFNVDKLKQFLEEEKH